MPRMKKIDINQQKMSDIKNKIIEVKDCTAAELVFLQPLTKEECEIIQKAFRYEATEEMIRIPKFKNSWKGLLFCLLSLMHLRYGEKITAQTINLLKGGILASEDYNYIYGCKNSFGNVVEVLPEIKGCNRCFVCCKLNSTHIEKCIRGLSEILGINEERSIIMTEYAKRLPHHYTSAVVDFPPLKLKPRMLDVNTLQEELHMTKGETRQRGKDFIKFQKIEHQMKLYRFLEETKV